MSWDLEKASACDFLNKMLAISKQLGRMITESLNVLESMVLVESIDSGFALYCFGYLSKTDKMYGIKTPVSCGMQSGISLQYLMTARIYFPN